MGWHTVKTAEEIDDFFVWGTHPFAAVLSVIGIVVVATSFFLQTWLSRGWNLCGQPPGGRLPMHSVFYINAVDQRRHASTRTARPPASYWALGILRRTSPARVPVGQSTNCWRSMSLSPPPQAHRPGDIPCGDPGQLPAADPHLE